MPRSNKKKSWTKPPPKSPTPQLIGSSLSSEHIIMKQEQNLMIARAVASAKKHGINLAPGARNAADGNCAFESAISNVNERSCFEEKYPSSHEYYRRIWATDMKNRTFDDKTWKILPDKEWEAGWQDMMESGVYERGIFGDLMLFGISCGIKKIMLIFNTNLDSPHDPIYVCDPRKFGVEPDTDVPVVLAYNLAHYESLKPKTVFDEVKTIDLVHRYLDGNYIFGKKDLPFLLTTEIGGGEEDNAMETEQYQMEEEQKENNRKRSADKSEAEIQILREKDKGRKKSTNERDKETMENKKETQSNEEINMMKNIQKERMKKTRANKSEEDMRLLREKDKERKKQAKDRNKETKSNEKVDGMKEKNKESKRKTRANKSEEEIRILRENDKERKKKAKDKNKEAKSNEEVDGVKEKNKESKKKTKANKSEEEITLLREKDKERKKTAKENKNESKYLARNAQLVLRSEQIVPELIDTLDNLGQMDNTCEFCKARKWKDETPSLCCNKGKEIIDVFAEPPNILQKLLTSESVEARLFRENIRSFNNGLALSSIKVNERKFKNGYNPSVIFEGKVLQMFGPIYPEDGMEPKFAQLYVHDSATEHTMRVKSMYLPSNLNKKQTDIITKTMETLQKLLKQINPFVKDLLHICEIPDDEIIEGKLIISCDQRPKGSHERTYNIQQSLSEVSVLTNSEPSDLVLRKRGGGLDFIYDIHPAAQSLHFILLFPYGTKGYSQFLKHTDLRKRVSPREFFAFHLNMRNLEADFLFRCGRLFQEYICLAYAVIESQKLKFHKNNQKSLRADTYKNVKEVLADQVPIGDHISRDDHNLKIGKRIVLSKSFVGSPRWYNSQFQDGMAICRKYHKPDFFITMTCNTNWREIQLELRKGEDVRDRPDLVARVFKQKKDRLIKDIMSEQILGKVSGLLWVIEFQKRGLPHTHILVILDAKDRITSSEDVDNVISAELPLDPESFPPGPKKEQAKRLEQIVLKNMVHGPCGKVNPSSPCMVDGKCTKGFPKKFTDKTIVNSHQTYPEYRRLDPAKGGRSVVVQMKNKEVIIDNSWIVPYSPFLLLRFNCHINDELCMSPTASKYLFKYATKGVDRAMVRTEIETESDKLQDEIEEYVDLRSIGSSEACWHIFNFHIAKKYPAVIALRVHMEEEQQIVFDIGNEEETLEAQRCTELTAFFEYNTKNPSTNETYVDFPEKFTWDNSKKEWKARKNNLNTIGRVHTVHPVAGDVYYLRMLLHHDHCRGCTSFTNLRKVNGDLKESYQEVCRALGLLQDDKEWDEALSEASVIKMPATLRELFVTIVLFCMPSNPKELFEKHFIEWADDFKMNEEKKGNELKESQIRTLVLLDIKKRLQAWDRDLNILNIKDPTKEELNDISFSMTDAQPVLIQEELDFDINELQKVVDSRKQQFTESQREVFMEIIDAVNNDRQTCVFIDARGGTGKTFILNAILAAVRMIDGGTVSLSVGATGIAANLLHLGRTFHSRFKAPLNITCESVCNIDAQSTLAELIRMSKIIVWDEAPMSHRYQMEALDRTLRDLTNIDLPFGGKIMVLSGDFRQCLPVLPQATRAEVVDAALNRSPLWQFFKVMHLSENMRVKLSNCPDAEAFDAFTLTIGNGSIECLDGTDLIEMPSDMCMDIGQNSPKHPEAEKHSMMKLAEHVYTNLNDNFSKKDWLNGRAILAPTNKQVDQINNLIVDSFPGTPVVLTSSDELINPDDFQRYNTEYLNSLSPSGLPSHRLFLKKGMPLMLMRNLNPKMGLCNGSRLIFHKLHKNHLLECTIAGGEHSNRTVLIPRISLRPKDREYPFEWSRRQFPVRVAFAMTINKSQGQTLKNVGVWLKDSCFAHGQLYVCISRVGSSSCIKFAISQVEGRPPNVTNNVVYREVLIW